MSKTPERIFYPHEVIVERFLVWSQLPTDNDRQIMLRNQAWNEYCDARDGLKPGASAARSWSLDPSRETKQLGFFQ